MGKHELYFMYGTMINNDYNNIDGTKKNARERLDELTAIRKTLELMPLYMVKEGYITTTELKGLFQKIDDKIVDYKWESYRFKNRRGVYNGKQKY